MKGKKAKVASAKKPRKAVEHLSKEECRKALEEFAEAQRAAIEKILKEFSSISN